MKRHILLFIFLIGCGAQMPVQLEMETTRIACNQMELAIVTQAERQEITKQQAKALVESTRVVCDELFKKLEDKANELD